MNETLKRDIYKVVLTSFFDGKFVWTQTTKKFWKIVSPIEQFMLLIEEKKTFL